MRISRAQTIAEYSLCLALIILAVVAMQQYVKRGIQGRYADVIDHATSRVSNYQQYEPYYVNMTVDGGDATTGVFSVSNVQVVSSPGGVVRSNIINQTTTIPRAVEIYGINSYDH